MYKIVPDITQEVVSRIKYLSFFTLSTGTLLRMASYRGPVPLLTGIEIGL